MLPSPPLSSPLLVDHAPLLLLLPCASLQGHYIGAVLPEYGGNARLEAIGAVLRPAATPLP